MRRTPEHDARARALMRPGRRKAVLALLLLAPASLLSLVAACLFGALPLGADEALRILASGLGLLPGVSKEDFDPLMWTVVLSMRFGRTLLAFCVGAALSVSGVVFQGVLRNPLADPFTLGVSSGAAFGASLAIALGLGGAAILPFAPGLGGIPFFALCGAFLALMAVLALGRAGGRLRRETLVLAGIVTASFLSALISLVKALNEESVAGIVFWIMGGFQGRGLSDLALFLPYFVLGLAAVAYRSRELDLLMLGETQAGQLGVDVSSARLILLAGASAMTGAAVAVCGVIGFLGLAAPHLVRLYQGADHRPLLVNAALLGGLLLVWSDVLARTILPGGAELPVGVVTALLGGPFFCLLLRRKAGEIL